MNTPQSPAMVEVDRLPELPDQYEAAAHMFPVSLAEFKERETTDTAYSIPVGSPDDGKSVPLWTSDQMRAYATEAIAADRAEVGRISAECEKLRDDSDRLWFLSKRGGMVISSDDGDNMWYVELLGGTDGEGEQIVTVYEGVTLRMAIDAARAALATTTQGEKY